MTTQPDATGDGFLAVSDVAAELSCSDDAVHAAIKRGDLAALKYGRLVRIKRSDLEAFIAAHTTPAKPQKKRLTAVQ